MSWVIHMLVDNVSKNGNLLLNIVQRPDGSLDPEVERMLQELADWNTVHGEAIFGTRPWLVYGESSVRVKGGKFKEDYKYNASEIRFTTKGPVLYAIALGWPEDDRITIRSLAKPAGANVNNISNVSLLGYKGKLEWKQTPEALVVTLPATKVSPYTAALKITGTNLKNIPFEIPIPAISPDARGNFVLGAEDVELHGEQIRTEEHGGQLNIGFWDRGDEWASWKVNFAQTGVFEVIASLASISGSSQFVIEVAGQQIIGKAEQTKGWDQFKQINLGRLEIKQPGQYDMKIRPKNPRNWQPMNLRFMKLTRVE